MEKTYEDLYIWQDREIRFDVSKQQLSMRQGEQALDTIANIEDTKGCNGDIGTFIFTNLRIIWYCHQNVKINLSIGYDCVITTDVKNASSKVTGDTKALFIKCKFNNNRFEFVFNSIANNTPTMFASLQTIYKIYDSSRLYRDLKIKGFLTHEKNLILLPEEKVLLKVPSVSNVTNDQAVLGSFYMTNVRIVWFSNSVDNFNVSLPWIQMKMIKTKDSNKFGKMVTIETSKATGSTIIGLKFNDNIDNILKELQNNYKTFLEQPILGVDLSLYVPSEKKVDSSVVNMTRISSSNLVSNVSAGVVGPTTIASSSSLSSTTNSGNIAATNRSEPVVQSNVTMRTTGQVPKMETNMTGFASASEHNQMMNEFNTRISIKDEVEVIETNYFNEQSAMIHYIINNQDKKNALSDITYSPELGLAIERLPDNVTLESLWKIII